MNETFSVAPGGAVESYQPHSQINQIYGVWIDNFSGGWLGIFGTGLWCPPYTRGWKASIFPGMSAITIRSYDFANGVRIAGATGQAAKVTVWDTPQGDSEGIAFFDETTVPRFDWVSCDTTGSQIVVGAPAVGRIRVYEIRAIYEDNGGVLNSYPAEIILFDTTNVFNRFLAISPAGPKDALTFVAPAGDIPIGSNLLANVLTYPSTYGPGPIGNGPDTSVLVSAVWANI